MWIGFLNNFCGKCSHVKENPSAWIKYHTLRTTELVNWQLVNTYNQGALTFNHRWHKSMFTTGFSSFNLHAWYFFYKFVWHCQNFGCTNGISQSLWRIVNGYILDGVSSNSLDGFVFDFISFFLINYHPFTHWLTDWLTDSLTPSHYFSKFAFNCF